MLGIFIPMKSKCFLFAQKPDLLKSVWKPSPYQLCPAFNIYILLIREKHFSQELCSCIWCCWTRTWHSSTSRCWRLGPGVQVTKSLYYCLDQSKFAIKHFNNKFTARTNFLWWPTLLNSTTSLLNRTQILVSHLRSKRLSKSPSSPNL